MAQPPPPRRSLPYLLCRGLGAGCMGCAAAAASAASATAAAAGTGRAAAGAADCGRSVSSATAAIEGALVGGVAVVAAVSDADANINAAAGTFVQSRCIWGVGRKEGGRISWRNDFAPKLTGFADVSATAAAWRQPLPAPCNPRLHERQPNGGQPQHRRTLAFAAHALALCHRPRPRPPPTHLFAPRRATHYHQKHHPRPQPLAGHTPGHSPHGACTAPAPAARLLHQRRAPPSSVAAASAGRAGRWRRGGPATGNPPSTASNSRAYGTRWCVKRIRLHPPGCIGWMWWPAAAEPARPRQ